MKSLVVANWKMNPPSWKQAKALFEATKNAANASRHISIVVAPPSLYLRELAAGYRRTRVSFATQKASAERGGAYTGQISLEQAKDAKIRYALIGHAEVRAAGQTDDECRAQVAEALALKLTPVLCVGEASRSDSGAHFNFIRAEIRAGFADVAESAVPKVVVAYEPIWAIGATEAMGPKDMHEMSIFIRKVIVELRGAPGQNVKVLYGGSIDETNAAAMMRGGEVQGLLIGRASTDAKKFSALCTALEQA